MQEEYRKIKVQGLRDYSVSNFGNFRNDFNCILELYLNYKEIKMDIKL